MDVLKIATAGSVDDGKSTLIGRLLYDTQSLTTDKLEAIASKSKQLGYDYLDLSLATDGLLAEREQGITIDVAHIYFSTQNRSYIIADTPGHIEYTRNMITGASTSQAAIVLIDARKGVIEQTSRHFFINNLLRIKNVIVAINKMDLVDYSEEKFNTIKQDFEVLIAKQNFKNQQITFIPISALKGDNVANISSKMEWYKGDSLLSNLENIKSINQNEKTETRFPVQYVVRPKTEDFHDFRGYAGKVKGGSLSIGDQIIVMPSQTKSKIKDIYFFEEKIKTAVNQSSVLITLENDINISRGDMIVKVDELPKITKAITATISWMDSENFDRNKKYVLQHGVNKVLTKVDKINFKINPNDTKREENIETLKMNDIAQISFKLNKPVFVDSYIDNQDNGSFILIDPNSNNTAGVGFIQ